MFRISDHRVYKAFKEVLEKNDIKFFIEWKPCAVALFCIRPEIDQVWFIKNELYQIEYNLLMK